MLLVLSMVPCSPTSCYNVSAFGDYCPFTSGVVPTTGNTPGSSGNLSEVPSTQAGSGANLTPPTTSASANTSTERDILCFFHCLNYRSMAQTIVYAGVLVICSAEPGKFNSLRQLWRILCNFACLIALGYPLLLLSFSDISLNFCGLVASRNARVLLAFISLVVFLYHRFGKVSAQPHTIVK